MTDLDLSKKTRRQLIKGSLGLTVGVGLGAALADEDSTTVGGGGGGGSGGGGGGGGGEGGSTETATPTGSSWLTIAASETHTIASDAVESVTGVTFGGSSAVLEFDSGATLEVN